MKRNYSKVKHHIVSYKGIQVTVTSTKHKERKENTKGENQSNNRIIKRMQEIYCLIRKIISLHVFLTHWQILLDSPGQPMQEGRSGCHPGS